VPGARAALLLDATGELVMESGARDERHRLIGAYQGITLGEAQRASDRAGLGPVQQLVSRYDGGHVLLQPLKEGYYVVLLLAPGARPGRARHSLPPAQAKMNRAL
jgi:predicted regulator of Ras-like GTPase activity (Roadblock/LC7/MglB family)